MNKQFVIEFIEEYRKYPCLWKIKLEESRDRNKKNRAYEILLKKLKELDASATIQAVKNKIDSMRAGFRRELKKKDSQRSGAGEEDVYLPQLWYFKYLEFLKDQETPRESISGIDMLTESSNTDSQLDSGIDLMSPPSASREQETDLEEDNFPGTSTFTATPPTSCRNSMTSSRASAPNFKRKATKADEILDKVSRQLESEKEDKFAVMGKNIANKLRELPKEIGIVTEKIINDILFEAQMGNITRNSRAIIQDSSIPKAVTPHQQLNSTTPQYYTDFGYNLPRNIQYDIN